MNEPRLNSFRLAKYNLMACTFRNVSLIFLIAFLSFTIFGGNIIVNSLMNGLEQARQRLGADLIIVPEDKDKEISEILLQGNAGFFYLDANLLEIVRDIEGVEKVTSQYYFASASSECCDSSVPLEIIGFDPDTDFIIHPWIENKLAKKMTTGEVVIGSGIKLVNKNQIKLYDEYYPVAAVMDETGTSMDQSVFATMDTLIEIRERATKRGFYFFSGEQDQIQHQVSSILVKVKEGYDLQNVKKEITTNCKQIEVVEANSVLAAISSTLKTIKEFYHLFKILFISMTIVTLFIVYSLCTNERRKEFSLLRMIGMSKRQIAIIIMVETLLQGIVGALIGCMIAGIVMYPFSGYISFKIGQPFLLPDFLGTVKVLFITITTSMIVGILASCGATYFVCNKDTYETLREGE